MEKVAHYMVISKVFHWLNTSITKKSVQNAIIRGRTLRPHKKKNTKRRMAFVPKPVLEELPSNVSWKENGRQGGLKRPQRREI